MSQRMNFITRLQQGERMTDLCREFGISRKTGYKLWNRWRAQGLLALQDQSRAPNRLPHKLPEAIVDAILALKQEYPTWGAKKLRVVLPQRHQGIRVPAQSTIHEVLARRGLVKRRKRKRGRAYATGNLTRPTAANELWCADFKGQFRLGDGSLCYPLTVTDGFSRYLIGCEALEGTRVDPARAVFEVLFEEYGLPGAIRTDNGVPFATTGLHCWSRLSAWWIKLGIELQRIEPGHPEQNGQHERFHLTLKRETTRPAGGNSLQQQERFDRFQRIFNEQRPHEALDMACPASLYKPSERRLAKVAADLEYPLHDLVRRVHRYGHINPVGKRKPVYVASALAGELVGLRELPDEQWLVTYSNVDLGVYHLRSGVFEPREGSR